MKKILVCLLFCFSLTALSAPSQYQIEVIAFTQLTSQGLDSEQWPHVSPRLNLNSSTAPGFLPSSDFKLGSAANNLEKDPRYKVLAHFAWRESLAELNKTQYIHLYGGQAYDANGKKLAGVAGNYTQAAAWQVNGVMSISLDHYFNLGMNLYFAEPMDELKSISKNGYFSRADDDLFYFHLQENRRSKSGELNYFDYPVAGVLVEIFPA